MTTFRKVNLIFDKDRYQQVIDGEKWYLNLFKWLSIPIRGKWGNSITFFRGNIQDQPLKSYRFTNGKTYVAHMGDSKYGVGALIDDVGQHFIITDDPIHRNFYKRYFTSLDEIRNDKINIILE